MLPKSVPPEFVRLVSAILACLLCIPFIRLHDGPIKLLVFSENQALLIPYFLIYLLSTAFVVPKTLARLGIRVRSRSVERLQAAERDDEDDGTVELPIRILRGEGLIRVFSAASYLAGFVCLLLAWIVPAGAAPWDPWTKTITLLSFAVFLLILGFLSSHTQPVFICEVSEQGILAPDGFWGRQTFVPWGDLVRCEIIRDDESWPDHFLVWDGRGRQRFKRSRRWMGQLRRSERSRVFRALMSRFPRKANPDRKPEPALAGVKSSQSGIGSSMADR